LSLKQTHGRESSHATLFLCRYTLACFENARRGGLSRFVADVRDDQYIASPQRGKAYVDMIDDERWMQSAIREAEQAYKRKEVPIGAVIVYEGKIVGRGYNQIETLQDPTAHAEIIAITAASSSLGTRRLENCVMYVTLEPCTMCAGAIVLARISRLVYGAPDPKAGSCGSLYDICKDARLNHQVETVQGILEPRCSALLKEFFKEVRSNGMGKPGTN
jgi:tRNA(adenine34) deaminase